MNVLVPKPMQDRPVRKGSGNTKAGGRNDEGAPQPNAARFLGSVKNVSDELSGKNKERQIDKPKRPHLVENERLRLRRLADQLDQGRAAKRHHQGAD